MRRVHSLPTQVNSVRAGNEHSPSLLRSTLIMTSGTALSRITGLVRLVAIAYAIGVAETRLTDTYNLANSVPNIIYDLAIGGILSAVLVPVFVDLLEREGRDSASLLASSVINCSVLITLVVVLIGVIAAPAIGHFYASRLGGTEAVAQQETLQLLLRLVMPQIVFYAIFTIASSFLTAHRRFGPPTFAPILNNLTVAFTFGVFGWLFGEVDLNTVSRTQVIVLGLGTTAGVALMALVQVPFLRGLGRYTLTIQLDHPSLRRLLWMSGFAVALTVTNMLVFVTVQWIANLDQGAFSAYQAALMIFLVPYGLVTVSLGTALLPEFSSDVVKSDWSTMRTRMRKATEVIVYVMLPTGFLLIVLSRPLTEILIGHGTAGSQSEGLITVALASFAVGLAPFSLYQLLLRGFFALQDTKMAFIINAAVMLTQVVLAWSLFDSIGVAGLALAHSVAHLVGVGAQTIVLSRRLQGPLIDKSSGYEITKILIAALTSFGAIALTQKMLSEQMGAAATLVWKLGEVMVIVFEATVLFVVMSRLLRIESGMRIARILSSNKSHPGTSGGS